MSQRLINRKGFTLIEVLITVAILGIILIAFLGVFSGSFRTIFFVGDKDIAVTAASDIMEVLYEEQAEEGYPDKVSIEDVLDVEIAAKIGMSGINNILYTVTDIDSFGDGDTGYKVDLVVEYGRDDEVTMSSFFRGSD